jgi:serine/threonine protein kinase
MIKPALRASTDGVLDPRCIEELPEHLLEKISRSKLTKDEIYSDWFFMLGILQFVGKCRFRNPWKEERKALHGPTGRDFRGDVSAHFIHNVNPMRLFRNAELIGQGGFGAVYVMVSDETKTQVAVKKMPHSNSKEIRENSWEVGLTLNCQHENVVELYKCYVWEDELWMVMEYLEGGSIADAVATVGAFSEETTAYVAAGVLKALVFMHDRHIVHRDLKSANVMLRSDATVKIIDFGLGRDISKSEGCTMLGSPFWMPPEMVQYRGHGTPADIFSCGITLIEMRTEHPPYYYSSVRALYTTGTKGADLDQYPQFSPVFRSFLQAALHFSPDDRATAAELLDDPFISMAADLESMRRLTRTIFAKQQLEQTGTLRHR